MNTHRAKYLNLCLVVLFLILPKAGLVADVLRAPVSWTGGGDGTSWSDAANWSSNPVLPDASSDVTINLAGVNTVTMDVDADINSLTLSGTNTLILPQPIVHLLVINQASSIGLGSTLTWFGGGIAGTGTLTNGGNINLNSSLEKILTTTLVNNGTIRQISGDLKIDMPGLLINNGDYGFESGDDIVATISQEGGFENTASGSLTKTLLAGTSAIRVPFVNNGGGIEVSTGTIEFTVASLLIGGSFNASMGATLRFGGGGSVTHELSGTLIGSPAGTVSLAKDASVAPSGATFDFSGTGIQVNAPIQGPGVLTNAGRLIYGGVFNALSATMSNSGTMVVPSGITVSANTTLTNSGLLELEFGSEINSSTGEIVNTGSGTIEALSSGPLSGLQTTLDIDVTNSGEIISETFTLNIRGDFVHNSGARMGGNGQVSVASATSVINSGIIGPGSSPGTFSWRGPFSPSASAELEIEIDDLSGPGSGHDQLSVSTGPVVLNGSLNVIIDNSYTPTVDDDEFLILNSPSGLSGSFSSINVTPGWEVTIDYASTSVLIIVEEANPITLELVAFLDGPYNGAGAMTTELNVAGQIPLAQPYNTPPYDYAGSEVLASVPSSMVDWVLVEVRDGTGPTSVVGRRAAVLENSGTITDVDGDPLEMTGVFDGSYYIVVYHRNHLAIMSANSLLVNGNLSFDFTEDIENVFGTNPTREVGGFFTMWGGDGDKSGDSSAFDFLNEWLPINGGGAGYSGGDFDLSSSASAFDFLNVWLPANGQSTQVP